MAALLLRALRDSDMVGLQLHGVLQTVERRQAVDTLRYVVGMLLA